MNQVVLKNVHQFLLEIPYAALLPAIPAAQVFPFASFLTCGVRKLIPRVI
jgi:hypothetical protein